MDGLSEFLPALGWGQIGATGLVVLAIFAIYKGLWVPRGLISREDHLAALAYVREQAEGRVADAHARVADAHRARDEAKEEARTWADAWRVSVSGQQLSAKQTVGALTAVASVAELLTSGTATRNPSPPLPDS